jgi:peptidoglycan-N-acetylglucosamine deacetylase
MSSVRVICITAALLVASGAAASAGTPACPGHPDAIGTSRTLVVDPAEHRLVGTMQYRESLPLEDKEVVLTFDDGPIPPRTTAILDILAANCVKATFFTVGQMAKAHPETLKRIHAEGHTIGTHTQTHPMRFRHLSDEKAQQEVESGIASAAAALNDPSAVAPFVRFPGLGRTDAIEDYLKSRSLMTWSADFPADDWWPISGKTVMQRALDRLEAKGKGILLLHDIHDRTVDALPGLLRELKARGYRIVHVVPATPDRPKTPTVSAQWMLRGTADHMSAPGATRTAAAETHIGTDAQPGPPLASASKADGPPAPVTRKRVASRKKHSWRHAPRARRLHQARHDQSRRATW